MNVHSPFQSPVKTIPTSRRARRNRMRSPAIWSLAMIILSALTYVYVGGDHGWRAIWTLKQEKSTLEQEVSKMEAKRLDLDSDLELLKGNPEKNTRLRFEMERIAREQHGMVRKDELVYRFHPEKPKPVDEAKKKP